MKAIQRLLGVVLTAGLVLWALPVLAGPGPGGGATLYELEFIPTQNAPGGIQGHMTIKVVNGSTIAHFRLRNGAPNALYTIWTVFNKLVDVDYSTLTGHSVPSCAANASDAACNTTLTTWKGWANFPAEGNGVSPTAPLGSGFTAGMGLDPGLTFVTNDKGDGEAQVKLDFDLVYEAPVSNKDIIQQCRLDPLYLKQDGITQKVDGGCSTKANRAIRITSTWLRKFVMDVDPVKEPCAYTDSLFWQCIDPATVEPNTGTGLPRVWRAGFDHFRLANHPDELTHGFIGGNSFDHEIEMVGRRLDVTPPVAPLVPAN